MKPTPDKLTVLSIASVMFDTQPEVTTLEVKQALRNHGFYAKQAEVSTLMIDIAKTEGWDFKDNGTHRTYRLAPISNPIVTNPIITAPVVGDWCVSSTTNGEVMYVDKTKTRDQVRLIYQQTHKVKWVDTRSRRVK